MRIAVNAGTRRNAEGLATVDHIGVDDFRIDSQDGRDTHTPPRRKSAEAIAILSDIEAIDY